MSSVHSVSCAGNIQQSYEDTDVRDALIAGPMWYYKCNRNAPTNDGIHMLQLEILSLVGAVVLEMVVLGV